MIFHARLVSIQLNEIAEVSREGGDISCGNKFYFRRGARFV